jgi:regulatory protein
MPVTGKTAEPLTPADARQIALKLLARREHSPAEMAEKLARKGCPPGVAGEVIGQLTRERLLSEDRFIDSYVQARRRRGYGPARIREELRQRGIGKSAIEPRLDAGSRDWLEELRQVRRKKFGAKLPGNYSERARQARFLQYRGFTAEQIQQVLNSRDTE